MKRSTMFLAVAAVASMVAPGAYAVDDATGFTCGFASTDDPTGLVVQDPTKQTGEIDCGPVAVVNASGGAVQSVTLTGCIQVNQPDHGGTGVCRSSTVSGNVGYLIDTISYHATFADDVYLCSIIEWESDKGGGSVQYDDDDVAPGNQCSLATSIQIPPEQ